MGIFTKRGVTARFKLSLLGGSKCIIGKNNIIDKTVVFNLRKNSVLKIGSNTELGQYSKVALLDFGEFELGDNCTIGQNNIFSSSYYGKIKIRNYVSMTDSNLIRAFNFNNIIIENDCMLSSNLKIVSGNGHSLYDLKEMKSLNSNGNNNKDIIIHEHVWVGLNSFIFSCAEIGSGSVVGANTFVNKKFPNNSCIAGNPAKIIREKIAWSREYFLDSYEDFKDFDYTNEAK